MVRIRDRIVDFRRVKASELKRNPKNFRMHSSSQREAMRGVLEDIGYVDALMARETPDGLELIDGEMRSEITPDMDVPVVIVDLNDEEVDKVLATFDPIGTLAEQDAAKLASLLAGIESDNADVQRLLRELDPDAGDPMHAADEPNEPAPKPGEQIPAMLLQPHEHYDYLVVLCTNSQEWNVLLELLKLEPIQRRAGGVGVARGIRGRTLIELLQPKTRAAS
ncbi:MAG: hypothetical protein ACOY0T_35670 [Myxococcota bacterium]